MCVRITRGANRRGPRPFNPVPWSVGFVRERRPVADRPRIGALSGRRRRDAPACRGVARAGRFAQVEVALLNGAPPVGEALARIGAAVVRVVPFFMEDGYFSRVAVPAALRGHPALFCPPVGVHDGMAGLIERQALAACDGLGVPSRGAAVLVVGHGSSSAPGRTLALHRHAARVAATELFARVEAACLEEAPFVADALAGAARPSGRGHRLLRQPGRPRPRRRARRWWRRNRQPAWVSWGQALGIRCGFMVVLPTIR